MNPVIGYTRRELVDLMMHYDIHTSVTKFEALVAQVQQKVIDVSGAAVEIRTLDNSANGRLMSDEDWKKVADSTNAMLLRDFHDENFAIEAAEQGK